MTRPVQVAVIGDAACDAGRAAAAEEVGRRLAASGATIVTGGLGGVMEAASRGARAVGGRAAGGRVVAVIPTYEPADANPHADVVVATGMGHARNVIVVASADAVIAVGGAHGTLSEIATALKLGRPVVGLGTWAIPGVVPVETPAAAVAAAIRAAR